MKSVMEQKAFNFNLMPMAAVDLAESQPVRAKRGRPRKIPFSVARPTVAQAVAALHTNNALLPAKLMPLMVGVKQHLMSPVDQRREPTVADLGWAAGLMDGEGCIHIARQKYKRPGRKDTYRLRLTIAQTSRTVLEEFEWAVGLQGLIASPPPTKKQTRICHALIYSGMAAIYVLTKLQGLLRLKKDQCKLALEFQTRCEIHRHWGPKGCPQEVWERRHWYYQQMQRIKRDR